MSEKDLREFVYVELDGGEKAIKTKDGLPMFLESVEENGEKKKVERTADVFHLLSKVPELGSDLQRYKEEARSMKDFTSVIKQKGIISDDDFATGEVNKKFSDWVASAMDAQKKVESFSDKDMAKVKNFDEMKSQLEKARDEKLVEQKKFYESQLTEKESVVGLQRNQINKLMIQDKFASSKFLKENCSHIPNSVIKNTFFEKFRLEEDNGDYSVVGYNSNGKQIYSPTRALEIASFDEALEAMMKEHPDKDYFFGGAYGNGTGNGAGRTSQHSIDADIEAARKNNDSVEVVRLKKLKADKQKK